MPAEFRQSPSTDASISMTDGQALAPLSENTGISAVPTISRASKRMSATAADSLMDVSTVLTYGTYYAAVYCANAEGNTAYYLEPILNEQFEYTLE